MSESVCSGFTSYMEQQPEPPKPSSMKIYVHASRSAFKRDERSLSVMADNEYRQLVKAASLNDRVIHSLYIHISIYILLEFGPTRRI